MNTTRLLTASLFYYWRTHLAVLLGVTAATAVIGGALIVGDSVRESLRAMTFDRLGQIDHVLHTQRLFREELGSELSQRPEFRDRFSSVAPVLVMQASFERTTDDTTLRTSRVTTYGVDERLWNLTDHGSTPVPSGDEIVLCHRVANDLNAKVGDTVTAWIELPATIPRDSLLGDRNETSREIALTVKAVLDESSKVGRLALNPNQQLPKNAFVSLETLQDNLDLAEVPHSPRNRVAKPARVNALFVNAKNPADGSGASAPDAAAQLTEQLSGVVDPADLNLRIVPNSRFGYLSLESDQQILEDALVDSALDAATELDLATSPVFVYLANELSNARQPDAFSTYSVIAGVDFAKEAPFGPWTFQGDAPPGSLGNDDIVLNDWLAADLGAKIGDAVRVKYHVVGSHGELPEEVREFTVRGITTLEGTPAADAGLTPTVEGITDADTFDEWEQPFEMDLGRVTDRDEDYWDQYRATPKAFISLAAAQGLWQSRYGKLTSLRVAGQESEPLEQTQARFTQAFLKNVTLEQTGLVFTPVKHDGLIAASGTTPFSALFISFSFFLILSATILIGLLFRLGIERRAVSVGVLSALGFSKRRVHRLLMVEGLCVVIDGALLGLVAAVAYASLMIYGLKTWWIGAIGTRFLDLYPSPASLALGFVISVAVASAAIWWAVRQLGLLTPRALLSGATEATHSATHERRRGKRASRLGLSLIGVSLVLMAVSFGSWMDREAFSGFSLRTVTFFLIGIASLTGSLSLLSAWLDADRSTAVRGAGIMGIGRLGLRNASRHRQRSVLTVALIASATFVIVAVAAGHRDPAAEQPDKTSGNGGFTLVGESSTPIVESLNTPAGRAELNLAFDTNSADANEQRSAQLLESMQVVAFRVKAGEEASCLNIYQTRLPTILGVPESMIERGGLKFIGAREENPWTLLDEEYPAEHADGRKLPVIPVLGDMNTLQYSLHKGVGATINGPSEANPEYKLKIVGMFDGSVFQGVLLMSESNFTTLYRDRTGYEYFLIEIAPEDAPDVAQLLENGLAEYGFDSERVVDRLANFLAVQNTYLSTFQTLGGLGLLLGTFGLATVMLRNVLERRAELALMRAVGFRKPAIVWLVLFENAFLLLWGLVAGTLCALLAMLPHLLTTGADVPWRAGAVMLLGVFAVGMTAALLAVVAAVRTPIVATLRAE